MTRLQMVIVAGIGLVAVGSMLAVLLVRANREAPLLSDQLRDVMKVPHPPKAAGSKLRAVHRYPEDIWTDQVTPAQRMGGKQRPPAA